MPATDVQKVVLMSSADTGSGQERTLGLTYFSDSQVRVALSSKTGTISMMVDPTDITAALVRLGYQDDG